MRLLVGISVLIIGTMSVIASLPTSVQRSSPVAVGESAPDFTLEDQNRNKVTLSNAHGKHPVVLVFYRGNW